MTGSTSAAPNRAIRDFGRGAGGALVFSLPMLMTMEMWSLGIHLDRWRLLVLLLVTFPLLVLLSHRIGFEPTRRWRDDVVDACIAMGIAAIVSSALLALFGAITTAASLDEALGKIALQMAPAALGALLARSQFGAGDGERGDAEAESYGGELFLMAIGALFLGFNVAPTEEMMLISYQMTDWHALALLALSLAIMQGFVFALGFAGGSEISPEEPWWSSFVRLTLPGYVIALGASLFLLWVFGRTEDVAWESVLLAAVVLAFPSAVGAAAARLIL